VTARALALAALAAGLCACSGKVEHADAGPGDAGAARAAASHSSTLAVSDDGGWLYVVNPDADSVSVVDLATRSLSKEILLAPAHPAATADGGAYIPKVMPRTLALSPDGRTLYVAGQRSGALHVIDTASGEVTRTVAVGSEPFGLVVSPDGASIFVAASQDDAVVRVNARTLAVDATAAGLPSKPWALALTADGRHLLVSHFLQGNVTALSPGDLSTQGTWTIPEVRPRGDRRLAHGVIRGLYDLAERPGTTEVWVAHAMFDTDVAQPELDFESTAFPSLSLFDVSGTFKQTLTTDAQDVPGTDGAFADVVSGPRAIAFTPDGAYALLVDLDSEDVLAVDANRRVETSLLRPLPGHMPEGIALSPDGRTAYLDERNTGDVAVIAIDRSGGGASLAVDGPVISRLAADPMPPHLRFGQHLFYSANSDEYPLTQNHWVACATCHMEGRSSAVTLRFAQGPRDTPSNAGGMDGTGFLFRTADRNRVQDYWQTIANEQGGHFDAQSPTDPVLGPLLDAITDYVNQAIPLPVPPTTDPAKVARGKQLFQSAAVGCAQCHAGPRFTDSGQGNPSLELTGAVLLHDVGTCDTGVYPDVAHDAIDGTTLRAACMFDTPSLNGIADSAPYLHDGSAATLRDVLDRSQGLHGDVSGLSPDDEDALVEYLRSL